MISLIGDGDAGLRSCMGKELLAYRKENGLSQERFAQMLKISARSYIDLEHGIAFPSAITLLQFFLLLEEQEMLSVLATIEEYLP